jgi:hypothetical protein
LLPETVLSAFHAMWDLFPEPVMLVHKNRTILATNTLGRDFGIPLGSRCHQLNPEAGDHHCRQCRANEALKTGQATTAQTEKNGVPLTAFWIPVQGETDLYIHFGLGTLALYEAAAQA